MTFILKIQNKEQKLIYPLQNILCLPAPEMTAYPLMGLFAPSLVVKQEVRYFLQLKPLDSWPPQFSLVVVVASIDAFLFVLTLFAYLG